MSGSVSRRLHIGFCCQVNAEEAGIGRGGIADGGRCTNAAAKTLQSLPSCSHTYTHHHNHTGRRVPDSSLQSALRGFRRVHAHQATEEQKKHLVWLYLSLRSHVGFVIAIYLAFLTASLFVWVSLNQGTQH